MSFRSIGSQYQPVDGYVAHPGIAGYATDLSHQLNFSDASPLLAFTAETVLDRYHDEGGQLNQTDQTLALSLSTRNQLQGTVTLGSHQLLLPSGAYASYNQPGLTLGYRDGTSTPTDVSYFAGRYTSGFLHTWLNNTNFELAKGVTLNLEADQTSFRPDTGALATQWLARAALAYQIGRKDSLSIGARRIIGSAPMLDGTITPTYASNIS